MSRFRRFGLFLLPGLFALVSAGQQEKPGHGNATRGKALFEIHCDECHDGYSREARVGPGLQGLKDGKLPDGKPATHDKLLDVVNNGPAEMPSFKERLTEQQKEDIVAFLMTL